MLSLKAFILFQATLSISTAILFPNDSGEYKNRLIGHARIESHQNNFDRIYPGEKTYDLHYDDEIEDLVVNNIEHTSFPRILHTGGGYDEISRSISKEIMKQQQNFGFESNDENSNIHDETIQLTISPVQDGTENQIKNKTYRTLKTGTTIVGVKTHNSIIIGADTRATEGQVVADKLCEKVHQLSQNIWCCGAGTSADLDAITRKIRYSFLLKSMVEDSIGNEYYDVEENGGEFFVTEGVEEDIGHPLGQASVAAICHTIREELYKNGGEIGANLVLGGYDPCTDKPLLLAIHPHGSIDIVPYTALGSGSLAAMGFLESRYKVDLSLDDAIDLVRCAVKAGIDNDLGSGSQIDICIIDGKGVKYRRGLALEERLKDEEEDKRLTGEILKKHISIEEKDGITNRLFSVGGVNGFGALPYRIKSRSTLLKDEDQVYKENQDWLMKIIS